MWSTPLPDVQNSRIRLFGHTGSLRDYKPPRTCCSRAAADIF
jgi:hypothetical protein